MKLKIIRIQIISIKQKKDNKISQIIQKEGIIELPQTKTRINYTI